MLLIPPLAVSIKNILIYNLLSRLRYFGRVVSLAMSGLAKTLGPVYRQAVNKNESRPQQESRGPYPNSATLGLLIDSFDASPWCFHFHFLAAV